MSRDYVVKQGDTIDSIAIEYGLLPDTIWTDPKNKALKDKRKNPNALLSGDVVYLKVSQQHEIPSTAKQKHKFKRKGFKSELKLVLLDDGEPRKNVAYTLKIDDEEIKGTTDGDGLVKEKIHASAKKGTLTIEDTDEVIELQLGYLDPADEPTGIQGRLVNLGYGPGAIDGDIGLQTQSAVRQFQKDMGLEVTGEPDQATIDKLDELFGE